MEVYVEDISANGTLIDNTTLLRKNNDCCLHLRLNGLCHLKLEKDIPTIVRTKYIIIDYNLKYK